MATSGTLWRENNNYARVIGALNLIKGVTELGDDIIDLGNSDRIWSRDWLRNARLATNA